MPEAQIDAIVADHRRAVLADGTSRLLSFAQRLCREGPSVKRQDVTELTDSGLNQEFVLESIVVTALGTFLCMLAIAISIPPEFGIRPISPEVLTHPPTPTHIDRVHSGPNLALPEGEFDGFAPFVRLQEQIGFVPNLLKAQMARPDIVEAQIGLIETILLPEDLLGRAEKGLIAATVSNSNRNQCGVALHTGALRAGGTTDNDSDRGAKDRALTEFAGKLTIQPAAFDGRDGDLLRLAGFDETQILEAAAAASLAGFLDTLQFGLGSAADFEPGSPAGGFSWKIAHPAGAGLRPTVGEFPSDPDADLVGRAQKGDPDAFEKLIEMHGRRIYRTLVGILGNRDDARDAMQDTFLKAFRHIGAFQYRSKFSTWLVSIAGNTGIERLRERRNVESLDDIGFESEEGFRPRQIQAWTDNPEDLYSRAEMRTLVETSMMRLPAKYRLVLILRDMEQLSTAEVASALGLGIPAVKARLLRGRLMLRETLAPHFRASQNSADAQGAPA